MSAIERYRELVRSVENDPEYLVEEVKLSFAEELCRLMEERGVTRAQLAERMSVSRAYITRILGTDYNLTAETMVKVARALGARVSLRLLSETAGIRTAGVSARGRVSRVRHAPAEVTCVSEPLAKRNGGGKPKKR
jgi:transcriptional regulator with XRE-family HTH domain